MHSPSSKRVICDHCLRPATTCICQWITPTANLVEVLILQHPMEVAEAKGTGRLLHLNLMRSRLACGESFNANELAHLIHDPWPDSPRNIRPVLLYPSQETGRVVADNVDVPTRLVILDATWRKSRKMLHVNPLLGTLPRLSLHNPPPSRYLIRKAHDRHQLSSYEAACQALTELEGDTSKYHALLTTFDKFMEQQQAMIDQYKYKNK